MFNILKNDRRLMAVRPDLADERFKGQVQADRFVVPYPCAVQAASTFLRGHPRFDASFESEALKGEHVHVFDEQEGWAWIQLMRDGYVGYVPSEDLVKGWLAPTHQICVPRSFVYLVPDIKTPLLMALSLNAQVTVIGEHHNFFKTSENGFIYAPHLSHLEANQNDVATVAEQMMNIPYLWGGKTSLGLDCSALVQLSLQACGHEAPRDSDMQEKVLGEPVAHDVLQRGDLVFWKGHVGMMQNATHMIHANAHHMMVSSEPLNNVIQRAGSNSPITSIRRI